MFLLIMGLAVLASITALVMPWINQSRIYRLQDKIKELENTINLLGRRVNLSLDELDTNQQSDIKKLDESTIQQKQLGHKHQVRMPVAIASIEKTVFCSFTRLNTSSSFQMFSSTIKSKPNALTAQSYLAIDQSLGAGLAVWIGGVALLLSGFFLVKYSIDQGLLSPSMRIILSTMLGFVFIISAGLLSRFNLANGHRITQALFGAGIGVLFASTFAASGLYQLISDTVALLGFCAITALSVCLSYFYGLPVALLGLAGGYLTPAFISAKQMHPSVFFLYLYGVSATSMVLSSRFKRVQVSQVATIGTMAWMIIHRVLYASSTSIAYTMLMLIALAVTIVLVTEGYDQKLNAFERARKQTTMMRIVSVVGALLMISASQQLSSFTYLEWILFGILSLGSIGMGRINEKSYGLLPYLTLVMNTVMLSVWMSHNTLAVFENGHAVWMPEPDVQLFATVLLSLGAVYLVSSCALLWRSQKPELWAGLISTSSIALFLVGLGKLSNAQVLQSIPLFWGLLAWSLAGLAGALWLVVQKNPFSDKTQQNLVGSLFIGMASIFITLGMAVEVDKTVLPIAITIQMLITSWIHSTNPLRIFEQVVKCLAGLFGLFLAVQTLGILISGAIMRHYFIDLYIVYGPLIQLGIPSIAHLGTAYFAAKGGDKPFVDYLQYVTIFMLVLLSYLCISHIEHGPVSLLPVNNTLITGTVFSNILLIMAVICLGAGHYFKQTALENSGCYLSLFAIARLIFFDVLVYNPLWHQRLIDGWGIFNSLLLPYGLPVLWIWLISELLPNTYTRAKEYQKGVMLILLFTLISLNVRYAFHGADLQLGETVTSEIYAYSMAWLIFGICLLIGGVVLKDAATRYAAAAMILLVVLKVFLYDAAELEGLYRVLSFLGLGVCLMGMSWFYTHFVSTEKKRR